MAALTGKNLLDSILSVTNVPMPDAVRLITAARLDQMIDSGFDSGLEIALVLSAASSSMREAVPGLTDLAEIVTTVKSELIAENNDSSEQTTYVGADHDTYPYSAVVYIESTFSSGITYRGSGAVVGENDVLTASHVVYSVLDGGLADEIRVYPGRDGTDIPFGSYRFGYVNYFEVDSDGDGVMSQQDSEDDLAVIGFDQSFGTQTGWFGLDPDGPSGYYNNTGYPRVYDDDTGPRMVNSYGLATKADGFQVFNYDTIETHPGSSGGPLWHTADSSHYIAGVSSTSGWAVDIASHYSSILDWIAGNDFLLDQPAEAAVTAQTSEYTEIELQGVPESDQVMIV